MANSLSFCHICRVENTYNTTPIVSTPAKASIQKPGGDDSSRLPSDGSQRRSSVLGTEG